MLVAQVSKEKRTKYIHLTSVKYEFICIAEFTLKPNPWAEETALVKTFSRAIVLFYWLSVQCQPPQLMDTLNKREGVQRLVYATRNVH